jgi:hypothetical protein
MVDGARRAESDCRGQILSSLRCSLYWPGAFQPSRAIRTMSAPVLSPRQAALISSLCNRCERQGRLCGAITGSGPRATGPPNSSPRLARPVLNHGGGKQRPFATQVARVGSAADLVLAGEKQGCTAQWGESAFDGGRNGRGKPVCSPAARPPWSLPVGAPIGTYAGNRGKPLRTCT